MSAVLPGTGAQAGRDQDLYDKLLERHARQPKLVIAPVSLTALAMAWVITPAAPLWAVISWLCIVAILLTARVLIVGRLHQPRGRSTQERLDIAVTMMAISGVVHGAALVVFPMLPQFERALLSLLLVGMSAGCVAAASGYPAIFRAYAIPTLGPLAVLWFVSPWPTEDLWVQQAMAVIIVLYGLALDRLASDTFRLFKESYEYRLELAVALEASVKANRAKTRFLASASHDMRQPIQTLSLFAAALAMRPLDERTREIERNINGALRDLTSELDALLDISKLDAGLVRVAAEPFVLQPILDRVQTLYQRMAEEKGVSLQVQCASHLCINIDRTQLDRVLRNLVENAIKYTDAPGSVRIEAQAETARCLIKVIDTGCGIPEHEQERIFEEFYQVNNPERARSRGLGLGLAIVQRLVSLMGIELTLRSAAGQGSTFQLGIPLCAASSGEPVPSPVAAVALQGLKALVVDDEEGVRNGMRAMLEGFGCESLLAGDTAGAIAIAKRTDVDILLADFRLRGADSGLHTLHEVRAVRPGLPALIITGDTAPDRLREAEAAGVTVLHKPVIAQVLVEEIQRLTTDHQ